MYKTAICHLYHRKNGNCVRDQHAQEPILIPEEVKQGWKKLHNEELHNLYSSLNITSEYEIGKENDRLKRDNIFRKPEGELLEKHTFRWKQNIQIQFSVNSA
jgi:hypothetical protein